MLIIVVNQNSIFTIVIHKNCLTPSEITGSFLTDEPKTYFYSTKLEHSTGDSHC